MKLTLTYPLDCTPDRYWALYFDSEYTTRLHTEALGSTSAEVVELDGDLKSGLRRTLRYGQSPDMPGPVKKIFGNEITTTEVSTFDPATGTSAFTLTPGTMADKTRIDGSVHVEGSGDGAELTFVLEARVKIFGVGPVVEKFIERQARDMQNKAVDYLRAELARD